MESSSLAHMRALRPNSSLVRSHPASRGQGVEAERQLRATSGPNLRVRSVEVCCELFAHFDGGGPLPLNKSKNVLSIPSALGNEQLTTCLEGSFFRRPPNLARSSIKRNTFHDPNQAAFPYRAITFKHQLEPRTCETRVPSSIAAPSSDRFTTRHLVLEPSPNMIAGSSTSSRTPFLRSSTNGPSFSSHPAMEREL